MMDNPRFGKTREQAEKIQKKIDWLEYVTMAYLVGILLFLTTGLITFVTGVVVLVLWLCGVV